MNAPLTISETLNITGDLTVEGKMETIFTETVRWKDNIVVLNNQQTGIPSTELVSGIEIERGTLSLKKKK